MFGCMLSWYQEKIALYDKQQWEANVEENVSMGLRYITKKSGRIKTELIDVDLVRGSSFPKTKPKHGWPVIAKRGLLRVLLLPIFYKWWIDETSAMVLLLLLGIYSLQLVSLMLFFTSPANQQQLVTCAEVLCPVLLMAVLGALHSQIVSTHHAKAKTTPTSTKTRHLPHRAGSPPRVAPADERRAARLSPHRMHRRAEVSEGMGRMKVYRKAFRFQSSNQGD
ncbi:PREDICTED: putative homeodomain transcription factor 2 [Priapulus caudatus]|uniref:Homeodomain transcription factor 2 n=1 Tax=Priapulus caudatus TaxID=37621 RepID=A0ABM1DSH2_PRICU|nr:PREDICTED: putative homeodomain transcription factor 2 [Priapulus caudatus]